MQKTKCKKALIVWLKTAKYAKTGKNKEKNIKLWQKQEKNKKT